MYPKYSLLCAAFSTLASAGAVFQTVTELDQAAFQEAQQKDETATRAFSNTKIKVRNMPVARARLKR